MLNTSVWSLGPHGLAVGGITLGNNAVLTRLSELARETFLLWDQSWVDFSWRHYYYEHTQRVRALALEIGRHEAADLDKLQYAALLHDITKRYDGKILRDSQGRRITNEYGFWRNELLKPARENMVTRLYREHRQFHKLHNLSGAVVAEKILESYGLPEGFRHSIASIIEGHLMLGNGEDSSSPDVLERNILYEADTMDANLGLIAFYRNIHINTHNAIATRGKADVAQYVSLIEPWIQTKVPFVKRMETATSIQVAEQRLEKMRKIHEQILDEARTSFARSLEQGLLGCVKYFMEHNEDPCLEDEMSYLMTTWIPGHERALRNGFDPEAQAMLQRAALFCSLLTQEIQGKS
jgi:putative nucleotidyltransferase with HDIG domain